MTSPSLKYLVLCVLALIALQASSRLLPNHTRNHQPGIAGQDWDAPNGALPESFDGWKKQSFAPPAPTDQLPDNQFWWTHQWVFKNSENQLSAMVSMDQANFQGWHELTHCYQATGWTLESRSLNFKRSTDGWPVVVAELSKPPNETAILAFSLFYEDGETVDSLENDMIDERTTELAGRLLNRRRNVGKEEKTETKRSIQCQTLAIGSNQSSESQIEAVVNLHLETRKRLRKGWTQSKDRRSSQGNQRTGQ